jgi:hypothetical protein
VCVSSLNQSELNGVIHSSDNKPGYSCYQASDSENAKFYGVILNSDIGKGYQGHQGHVSLFHPPSWDESGSSVQFLNFSKDAKGNSDFDIGVLSGHFKQVFSVIGPTGAEIWPFYELPFEDFCNAKGTAKTKTKTNYFKYLISKQNAMVCLKVHSDKRYDFVPGMSPPTSP